MVDDSARVRSDRSDLVSRMTNRTRPMAYASLRFSAGREQFTGQLRTLTLNIKVKLVSNDKGENESAPDFRLHAAGHDFGDMKGAFMKLGQMASYLDVGVTAPWPRSRRHRVPSVAAAQPSRSRT